MRPDSLAKPLGVFALVILAVVGLGFLGGLVLGGGGTPSDAGAYSKQVPSQYQPENVLPSVDAEKGKLSLDAGGGNTDILIDTQHSNKFSKEDIEPLVNALVRKGHDVQFKADTGGQDSFGTPSYNETIQGFDAVLIIHPTGEFPSSHVDGLERFARAGGHVAVLSEPTQMAGSSGPFASPSRVRSTANALTSAFGIRVGADTLYNVANNKNDNNYKSIYGKAVGSGPLTNGVNRVNFETSAYLVVQSDSDATTLYRAPKGTKKMSSRRAGQYALAARSGNLFVTADSSFITVSEMYDSDNEKLVSNLLEFLVAGEKPDDVPAASGGTGGGGFGDDDSSGGGEERTSTPTPAR